MFWIVWTDVNRKKKCESQRNTVPNIDPYFLYSSHYYVQYVHTIDYYDFYLFFLSFFLFLRKCALRLWHSLFSNLMLLNVRFRSKNKNKLLFLF